MKTIRILAAFSITLLGAGAVAQTTVAVQDQRLAGFTEKIAGVLDAKANHPDKLDEAVNELLGLQHNQAALLRFAEESQTVQGLTANQINLAKKVAHDTLGAAVEQSRTDEQFGSASGLAGSTSAVAKAGLTSLLSAAIESGAITQAINGNTATFSANADGLLRFIADANPFPFCDPDEPTAVTIPDTTKNADANTKAAAGKKATAAKKGCGTPILRDIGVTTSFDIQQGSTKTVATSPGDNPPGAPSSVNILTAKNRFSGVSVKYVFRNPQDIRSKTFQDAWTQYYSANSDKFKAIGNTVLAVLSPSLRPLIVDPNSIQLQQQFRRNMQDSLKNINDPAAAQVAIEQMLATYLEQQLQRGRQITPNFDQQLNSAVTAYAKFLGDLNNLVKEITTKTVFSAEYNFQRPVGQPETSQFRIMSTLNPFGAEKGNLSVNLAGTFYNSSSVSGQFGRWRDAQASLQLERKIGGDMADYPARFSLAGYFQYMISPGLISLDQSNFAPGTNIQLPQAAALALSPTGPIWIAEAKITIKLKSSGAEIPFAVTRSNRTDLIQATSVRGHVGITYDLDKLFAAATK